MQTTNDHAEAGASVEEGPKKRSGVEVKTKEEEEDNQQRK